MSADEHHDDQEAIDNEHDEHSEPVAPLSVAQIEEFWQEFVPQLPELAALPAREFVERANELLQPFAAGLALELEHSTDGTNSLLVATAHGSIEQFENVLALVRHAPQIPGYRLQAFRSRALGSDFSMGMDGFSLACSDVLVGHYDAGGVVGLELTFEKIIAPDMLAHAQHMAFIMLDHVLGEWDFAVRVGPVEFVDAFSDEVAGAEPLSVFPPIFDAFIRNDLGRSYQFPSEEQDRGVMLEARAQNAAAGAAPDLLSFRLGANALATRADLCYFLQLRYGFDSQQDLDQVRDAHDALGDELERLHAGLMVFTRVEQMSSRVAAYYVENAEAAQQLAQRISAEYAPLLGAEITIAFDPGWEEYLALYNAINRNRHDEEGSE